MSKAYSNEKTNGLISVLENERKINMYNILHICYVCNDNFTIIIPGMSFKLPISITDLGCTENITMNNDGANMPDNMERTSMTPDGGEEGMNGQEMNKTMPSVAAEPEPNNSTATSALWSYRMFGLATLSFIIIH